MNNFKIVDSPVHVGKECEKPVGEVSPCQLPAKLGSNPSNESFMEDGPEIEGGERESFVTGCSQYV